MMYVCSMRYFMKLRMRNAEDTLLRHRFCSFAEAKKVARLVVGTYRRNIFAIRCSLIPS